MARCIAIDTNGFLVDANQSPSSCTDFILMDSLEFSEYPTLIDIFAMPVAADIQTAFAYGFTTPLVVFMVAWSTGRLLKMFNKGH